VATFAEAKVISVLPGSRIQEVKRMLPLFRDSMHRLAEDYPHIAAVIPTPHSSVVTNMVQESVLRWEIPAVVLPAASDLEKYDAFAVSFRSYPASIALPHIMVMACSCLI
jgi:lipid-A-disaccharide synthase